MHGRVQALVDPQYWWQVHSGAHSHSSCCRGAGSRGISVMGHSPSHRCFSLTSRSASGGACAHTDRFLPCYGMPWADMPNVALASHIRGFPGSSHA